MNERGTNVSVGGTTSQTSGAHVADLLLVQLPLLVAQGQSTSSAVVRAAEANYLLVSSFHKEQSWFILRGDADNQSLIKNLTSTEIQHNNVQGHVTCSVR